MISLEQARSYVLDRCPPGPRRTVAVAEARGRVLAEPVVSSTDVPAFANSAMDGFAVQAEATAGATGSAPATLRIVGTLRAGMAPDAALDRPVAVDEAVRIMTGAPLPAGADAVVPVEATTVVGDGAAVSISIEVERGRHVRPAGDDLAAGDVVFGPATVLGPAQLGVLTSIGLTEVTVHRHPVVAVFSTGDELVPAGQPLAPGQIHDSNRTMIRSALAEAGFATVDLGLVADDEDSIAATITDAVGRCDAVITTGGVSMGDFDYVKVVLDRMGDMAWMQVAIRPAKPLAFGTVDRPDGGEPVPVFGLPGNPVSCAVSFELFARPALRQMAGYPESFRERPRVQATAEAAFSRRADGKVNFVRARCRWDEATGGYRVAPAGAQGSHQLRAFADADSLVRLPDGPGAQVGDRVEVWLLR